jgi:hypothetical protein
MIRRGMAVAKSRHTTFVTGALLCSACTFLVTVTTSLLVSDLLAGVAIFGLNVASCALLAMMSDMFPETALARVCGLAGVGEGIIAIALTLCAGIILDRFTFDGVFSGAAFFPLVSVGMLYLLIRPATHTREQICHNQSALP